MRTRLAGLLAVGLMCHWGHALAQEITYDVNLTLPGWDDGQPIVGTVTGTITTDGSLGVLSAADVLNWNLALTSGFPGQGPVQLFGPGSGSLVNSTLNLGGSNGSPLDATASLLTLEPGPNPVNEEVQFINTGFVDGYFFMNCGGGGYANGCAIAILSGQSENGNYTLPLAPLTLADQGQAVVIPPPPPPHVPEPGTLSLLTLGLAGMGFMRLRKKN